MRVEGRRGLGARLGFVIGLVAATSVVLAGAQVAQAAPPTLAIPGRLYPVPGQIMDFAGTDPISGDNRAIQVTGLVEAGCNPVAQADGNTSNDYVVSGCPNIQLQVNGNQAGLLRLPSNTVETVDGIQYILNQGAVITQSTDPNGKDGFVFHVTGHPADVQNVLGEMQFVPCNQQDGTPDPAYDPVNDPNTWKYHAHCGAPGVDPATLPDYEERQSEDSQLPDIGITAVQGDGSGNAMGNIYLKVEGTNGAPTMSAPLSALDAPAGSTLDVDDQVSVVDMDMCNVARCGASYVGPDKAETDDQMLLVTWLADPNNCGTYDFFGTNFFTDKGGSGTTTMLDLLRDWTGLDLNDAEQGPAATVIANAVLATLPPDAVALDLTAQVDSNTKVWAGVGGIKDVIYSLANIDYHAPADDATCHLNIAVSDLGNNGRPSAYIGSPYGPEAPCVTNCGGDDVPYEIPDAQAAVTNVAFNVADAHPDVTISQILPGQLGDPAGPNKPSGFTITFSEPVEGFDAADLSLSTSTASGAALGALVAVTPGLVYTVPVTANGDGTIKLEMTGTVYAVGHAGDADFANDPPTYDDNEIKWDQTGPTVTIDQALGQADPVNVGPIVFTVEFSDTVSTAPIGFDASDVDLSTSTAPGSLMATVTQPDLLDLKTYEVSVTGMTGPGMVVATVKPNAIVDTALNGSQASTSTDNSVMFDDSVPDVTAPTVTINQAVGQADPTAASPIMFDVVFSEPVADFATGDVTLGGTAGATTAIVSGSGTTYTVAVSGMTMDGTVTAAINAGVAHDAAANANDASTSTDNMVTFDFPAGDVTAPDVTIDQAAAQADPTSTSPIAFTVVFSEPVAGFATGDVTLSGTAGATTATVSGSGANYTVAVSGMSQAGTVIASIAAGVAHDAANNPNTASTSLDNSVTWTPADVTPPTVTINQSAAQADPTGTSPIMFDVVFSEAVADFATGDVTLAGTAGATTATVSGSGTTYTVAVSGMSQAGTVIASIAAGVAHDAAANANTASTSADNTVTWSPVDVTPPTVTINQAAGQVDPAVALPILFDVVFSEPVTGFASADVLLAAPSGATAAVSGSGAVYTVSVTGMTEPGPVVASIPAGVAADAAANTNTASTSVDNSVTYAADSESTPGGTVSVTATGGVLTAFDVTAPQVAPPAGVTFPYGQFTYSATTSPGGLVTFDFVLPATVDAYYKLVGGAWEDFTWNGTTGTQVNGTILSVTIQDNGRGDSDPTPGIATDPGAPALVQAVTPSSSTTTTTTVPGGGGTTTTTTVPGGGGTTTTTTTTDPGGGGPTTTVVQPGPGVPGPIPALPATGGSPLATLALAALATGLGTILVTVRRRAHR